MKSYMANAQSVERKWYVVDAEGQTLGRLASEIAKVLRGKNKPIYTPHVDTGDYVIVVNAEKINVSGKKLDQKIYYHHSDYVGGMKETTLKVMLEKKQPLSELLKDMKIYPQVLKNVRVRDKKEAREDAEVQAAVKAGEAKLNGDGRILLRESGTEPVIRVMAEAGTMELCNEVVDDIVAVLQKFVQK